ncbi:O-antigen ligase domain-containing protein [Myxacorys almedinensis]|uniref:O-antigen ligase domain-containing protein n=1 Tax=Myxacorys almedinensis A TaxID=2690445 RepID=A0A8J7Z2J1_9CYAN|nr:O-antigen ligase domain-containing protein [Myxacorys almedinensis]NDJ16631.1 O-antigen ligase domain-containing protein [Myxacorys almedinensis A]
MSTTQPRSNTQLFQPAIAWLVILSFSLFVAAGIALNLGRILVLAYPIACLVVGAFLYFRYPILYIGFTWWIWFLSAFLRRVIEMPIGLSEPSPILLAPFFVTFVSVVTLARQLPVALYGTGLPFILCLASVCYGGFIGLMSLSIPSVIVALLNWLSPILFGFHLFANWRQFPAYRQVTQRVFVWGVLVMGLYGIVQFLIAPPWDRFWLENITEQAFGTPNPLGIRVFSTMQSPQPFAATIVAGLFLLLAAKTPLKFPASAVGYLALLLSLARSAWLSWFVGIVVLLPSLKPRLQMRLLVTLLTMMLLVLPLATIEPFSTVIGSRLQTLGSGGDDISVAERQQGYNRLLGEALVQIKGQGLGYAIADDSIGSNDSGVLTILLNLGWVGTLPYMGGLLLLMISILQSREAAFDPFVSAARAIAIATFSQFSLNNVILSVFGMVLWGFVGLSLAARLYYAKQRQSSHQELLENRNSFSN